MAENYPKFWRLYGKTSQSGRKTYLSLANTNSLLNKTLKQRVNSVVLKALADNSDRERRGGGRGEELNNNVSNNKVIFT